MPKELLSGSLEEQCDFLYDLAVTKMGEGNYTGAAHLLKDIVEHSPDYRDAAHLLAGVKARKSEQRTLLLCALLGLTLGIGVGTKFQVRNDLWMLLLAGVGAVIGYGVANLLISYRRSAVVR